MLKNGFYLSVNFLPGVNADPVGEFYLGTDNVLANEIFQMLDGEEALTPTSFLFIELMEVKNSLPLNLLLKSCTLQQLGENCKIITREMFRKYTLD